jgi:NhaP-type Na+/H+ or K+/H+ antiporter
MIEQISIQFFLQIFTAGCVFGFLVGFLVFWFWLRSVWLKVKKEIDSENNNHKKLRRKS